MSLNARLASEEKEHRHQTARAGQIPFPVPTPAMPPVRASTGNCHPVVAELLRRELTLQDELADTRQELAEAAMMGQPMVSISLVARLIWIRAKIRLCGFVPPKAARRPRPPGAVRLSTRLHLRWIRTIEYCLRWPKPVEHSHSRSWDKMEERDANLQKSKQSEPNFDHHENSFQRPR